MFRFADMLLKVSAEYLKPFRFFFLALIPKLQFISQRQFFFSLVTNGIFCLDKLSNIL